jgi:hypothetical protein
MKPLLRVMIIVALVLAARGALEAPWASPFVTHRLTDQCAWAPRAWARAVGFGAEPTSTGETRDARYRCWLHRGLKSRIPMINVVKASWPVKGDANAHDGSLPAGRPRGPADHGRHP